MATTQTTALITLSDDTGTSIYQSLQLKRLALFFDRIQYIRPEFTVITNETLDSSKTIRREEVPEEQGIKIQFDPFLERTSAILYPLDMLGPEIESTIDELTEVGIVSENIDAKTYANLGDNTYRQLRHDIAWMETKDPIFVQLSGTNPNDQPLFPAIDIDLYGLWDDGVPANENLVPNEQISAHVVLLPSHMRDTTMLSDLLYEASVKDYAPVLLNRRHRAELRHRYDLFQQGQDILTAAGHHNLFPDVAQAAFGEVTFRLGNAFIDSQLLVSKSLEDIVRYREANDEARRRFVSEHLWEATSLVQDNPWDNRTKAELTRFMNGKVRQDLLLYEDHCESVWEKLFGTLPFSIAKGARDAIIAGTANEVTRAGGVLGDIVPEIDALKVMALALVTRLAINSPEIVQMTVNHLAGQRKLRRSGITYLANFQ